MLSRIIQQNNVHEQIVSEFAIRPLRFGYIINREIDQSEFRQIYQYNTSLWGGKYNLFVPTDGKSIRSDWWRQLFFHDPDLIYLVGEIETKLINDLYKQLQPMNIWKWSNESLKTILGESNKINPLHMDVLLENLFIERGKLEANQSNIRYPVVNGDFAQYTEIITGTWLPESKYQTFAEKNLGALKIEFSPTNLKEYLNTLDEIEKWITPLRLSGDHLRPTFSMFGFGKYSLLISTGLLDDLFIYHALRWSNQSNQGKSTCVIIPVSALANDNDYLILAEWFGSKVKGNTFDIVSYSVELENLISIRDKLKHFLPPRRSDLSEKEGWVINLERCNIDAPVPTVIHLKQNQVVNIQNNHHSFQITQPSFLDRSLNKKYENRRWICELDLSPGFGNKQGFTPSMFFDLNFILSNSPDLRVFYAMGSWIRIARGNIAFFTTMTDDIGSIQLPSYKKVVETACENAGYAIGAGKNAYYQGMINLLGNLQDAKFLHDPNIFKLFFHPLLVSEKALTLIEMFDQLKISKSDKPQFQEWIQFFASKQILLRGYNLLCPVCGLSSWYELARINEHMICEGCRAHFQIPIYIDFAYRLNRLFVDRQNQGAIAVLLTLLLLYETASHGLIWQADINLTKNMETTEIDIIAMCDGYLVLTECKNSFMPFQKIQKKKIQEAIQKLKSQLEREIKVAVDMEAHLFLFATLEKNIPPEIIEFIQEQDAKYEKLHVRLVTRSELMNGKFHLPEKHERLITMSDIARNYILPPFYKDDNCSSEDENWPHGAVSMW